MPLSNPVIRRYTPPTCTLEIWAQKSPISRWAKQSVLKQLTFELQLDDPRLSEEDKVTIRGDREQLEALCTRVSDYVQELLQKDTENFWLSFQGSQANHQAINEQPPEDLSNGSATHTSNTDNPNTDNSNSGFSQMPTGSIRLQPDTHLKHKLFLGSLANQSTGESLQLSLLQLFDLATALENYSAEFIALPVTSNNKRTTSPLSTWGPVAAVVAIAAGLTPLTWQYANRLRQQQLATKSSSKEESVALNSPSSQELPTPVSTLTSPTPLPLQSPLSSNVPFPVNPLPAQPSVSPEAGIAGARQQKLEASISTPSQASSNTSSFTKPLTSQRDNLRIPGAQPNQIGTSSIKVPTPKEQSSQTAIKPDFTQKSTATITRKNNTPEAITNRATSSLTSANNLSPKITNQTPKPPSVLSPNISFGSPSNSAPDRTSTSDLITKLRQNRLSNSSNKIATGNSSLFDANQIAEVTKYLKKRWQPPSGLKQTLEYSLTVGVDGSIERILPLGKAARENFSYTGMPAIGQPFISPSKNGQDARIRAIFKPNGKVQAFPETE